MVAGLERGPTPCGQLSGAARFSRIRPVTDRDGPAMIGLTVKRDPPDARQILPARAAAGSSPALVPMAPATSSPRPQLSLPAAA